MHKGLLRRHSLWFRIRLNGNWGKGKEIQLEEEDDVTLGAVVRFLYKGRLWDMSESEMGY